MASEVKSPREEFYAQCSIYWNQGGFHKIYVRIQTLLRKANEEREAAKKILSEHHQLEDKSFFITQLGQCWRKFKENVREIRAISSEGIAPLDSILESTVESTFRDESSYVGDFNAFSARVEALRSDLNKVYRDALYPWLLALQNANGLWNPTGVVCRVSDYVSWWRCTDPVALINKAVPKTEQAS